MLTGSLISFLSVSRLDCLSETYEAELILDINCEIYAIHRGERFTMALSTTLDGQTEKAHYDPKPAGTPSLMDTFEYVMNGKVFKIQEDSKAANKMFVPSASFCSQFWLIFLFFSVRLLLLSVG